MLKMKLKTLVLGLFILLLLTGCAIPIKDIERAKAESIPLIISGLYPGHPNSAGGVNVHINFINTSNQTIKYVVITVLPYNRVGDIAPSEIGRTTYVRVKYTGPLKSGHSIGKSYWANVWYNNSISCVKVTRVKITYMSGKSESFSGKRLSKLMVSSLNNSCSAQ